MITRAEKRERCSFGSVRPTSDRYRIGTVCCVEHDTRQRFVKAALTTALLGDERRSVRTVAAEALATPSLLYRYFGSFEDLEREARTVGLGTVLGDDLGHGYLVDLLGGVANTEPLFDPDDYAPSFIDNELFPKLHIAWLRRNAAFVVWLFKGHDFADVFEAVRPGLAQALFFRGAEVHEQTFALALDTMAAWVCHSATCGAEELPEVLRWAGDTVHALAEIRDEAGLKTTLSEAVESFSVDGVLLLDR